MSSPLARSQSLQHDASPIEYCILMRSKCEKVRQMLVEPVEHRHKLLVDETFETQAKNLIAQLESLPQTLDGLKSQHQQHDFQSLKNQLLQMRSQIQKLMFERDAQQKQIQALQKQVNPALDTKLVKQQLADLLSAVQKVVYIIYKPQQTEQLELALADLLVKVKQLTVENQELKLLLNTSPHLQKSQNLTESAHNFDRSVQKSVSGDDKSVNALALSQGQDATTSAIEVSKNLSNKFTQRSLDDSMRIQQAISTVEAEQNTQQKIKEDLSTNLVLSQNTHVREPVLNIADYQKSSTKNEGLDTASLRQQLNESVQQQETQNSAIQSLSGTVKDLTDEVARLQKELSDAINENEENNRIKVEFQKHAKEQAAHNAEFELQIEQFETEKRIMAKKMSDLQQQCHELQKQNQQVLREKEQYVTEITEQQQQLDIVQQQINQESNAKLQQMAKNEQQLRLELDSIKQSRDNVQQEKQNLTTELRRLNQVIESKHEDYLALKSCQVTDQQQLNDQSIRIKQLSEEIHEKHESVLKLSEINRQLQDRLDLTESEIGFRHVQFEQERKLMKEQLVERGAVIKELRTELDESLSRQDQVLRSKLMKSSAGSYFEK